MARRSGFARAYSTAAVVILNCLLLAAAACGAIAAVSAWRHLGRADFGVSYSSAFDQGTYRLLDPAAAAELGAEFDRMGEHQSFVSNPWTTFMAGPFAGRHLNVVADPVLNHRATPAPAPADGRPDLVVWAFGGSTLFGWGLSDDTTVAAQLQRALQERLPERRVVVVNYGQPYWFSSVELAALPALLRHAERRPHLALFLDGLNDTVWGLQGVDVPPFADRAHAAWERVRADLRRELPWFSVNASFPPLRVVDWLRVKGLAGEARQERRVHRPPADPERQVVENFRRNRAMAARLLQAEGVRPVFVLQPVPFWGSYQAPSAGQGAGAPGGGREVYRRLAEEAAGSGSDLADLSGALLGVAQPYVDAAHYSDAGARALAEAMAAKIAGDFR